jgi:hypothetical protein
VLRIREVRSLSHADRSVLVGIDLSGVPSSALAVGHACVTALLPFGESSFSPRDEQFRGAALFLAIELAIPTDFRNKVRAP